MLEAGDNYGFKISVDRLCFGLQRMAEVCDRTLPHLVMDYAIFVVHADESRLSINEDNAGIGYARLYRALLQKTGGSQCSSHWLPLFLRLNFRKVALYIFYKFNADPFYKYPSLKILPKINAQIMVIWKQKVIYTFYRATYA